MKAQKISVDDIRNLGSNGTLSVELPTLAACYSARALMNYARYMYPRTDGYVYTMSIDKPTNTVTIRTVKPEEVKHKRTKKA
jgi:hypothetical protein